jgi:hypothetical protein
VLQNERENRGVSVQTAVRLANFAVRDSYKGGKFFVALGRTRPHSAALGPRLGVTPARALLAAPGRNRAVLGPHSVRTRLALGLALRPHSPRAVSTLASRSRRVYVALAPRLARVSCQLGSNQVGMIFAPLTLLTTADVACFSSSQAAPPTVNQGELAP